MKKIIFVIVFVLFISDAFSEVAAFENQWLCKTENSIDNLIPKIVTSDRVGVNSIKNKNVCFPIPKENLLRLSSYKELKTPSGYWVYNVTGIDGQKGYAISVR